MCGDDTTLLLSHTEYQNNLSKQSLQSSEQRGRGNLESAKQKLKVGLLEERLSRTLGVGRVGDDDVELVLVAFQELEAVADVDGSLGAL